MGAGSVAKPNGTLDKLHRLLAKDDTMRAVGLFTHGGPEVLQVVDLPEVHAGPGQVLIGVIGGGVNRPNILPATAEGGPAALRARDGRGGDHR